MSIINKLINNNAYYLRDIMNIEITGINLKFDYIDLFMNEIKQYESNKKFNEFLDTENGDIIFIIYAAHRFLQKPIDNNYINKFFNNIELIQRKFTIGNIINITDIESFIEHFAFYMYIYNKKKELKINFILFIEAFFVFYNKLFDKYPKSEQNIIDDIIKYKASKLASFLVCKKIKINLDNYIDLIKKYYNIIKNDFKIKLDDINYYDDINYNDEGIKYKLMGNYIGFYSDKYAKINIENYGSEAYLLNIINSFIIEDNLNNYLIYIRNFKNKKNKYSINEYFIKIGIDIAVILSLFYNNSYDLNENNIKTLFKKTYNDEIMFFNNKQKEGERIELFKKVYLTAIEIDRNIANIVDKSKSSMSNDFNIFDIFDIFNINQTDTIKCQRLYNLYKYPIQVFYNEKNEAKNYFYINNVILRFKD